MRLQPERTRGLRGVATVEMAVIAPVVVLLVLGMIEASRMCQVTQILANAAREGCRVAISIGKTSADVTTRVESTLSAAGINPALVTVSLSPSSVDTTHLNTQITLTLSVNFTSVNWIAQPFFFKTSVITSSCTMYSQRT